MPGYWDSASVQPKAADYLTKCRICTLPRPDGPICEGCHAQAEWLEWSIEELEVAAVRHRRANEDAYHHTDAFYRRWCEVVDTKPKYKAVSTEWDLPNSIRKWLEVQRW